jgi:hypothetical protein
MASGWNEAQKKVIRNNGRNTGPTIWNDDAVAAQVIDDVGHDTNDETLADSITETLNLRGWNAMLGNLDVGTFKMVNVSAGTVATDGINKGQLDSGLSGKIGEAPIDGNNYNRKNAEWAIAAGGTNPNDIITAQSFDSQNLTSTRASGDFVTEIRDFSVIVADTLKAAGLVRHALSDQGAGDAAIDVDSFSRFRVNNDGALTMTFEGLSTTGDNDLPGGIFHQEGSITILNGATPGTITIAGLGTPTIIGSQNTTPNAGQVLTYIIQRISGVNWITIIWTAV